MVARVPDDRLEGAGGLRPDRGRLVIDGARGELDAIPGQDVRGNELGERLQRATSQLGLRPGSHDRSGEPVRGAHVGVGEPGHGDARDDTPAARPSVTLPPPPFGGSLALGLPVVRRVEPGALVARGERLKHALDLLPGRRAADQAVLGDPLLDLEGRAVLAAVDVHGHGQPRFFYAERARALGLQRALPGAAARRVTLRLTQEGRTPWPTSRQQSSADATIANSANARRRRAPVIPPRRKRNKRAGATRRLRIETSRTGAGAATPLEVRLRAAPAYLNRCAGMPDTSMLRYWTGPAVDPVCLKGALPRRAERVSA